MCSFNFLDQIKIYTFIYFYLFLYVGVYDLDFALKF